jgi:hypothetical protein
VNGLPTCPPLAGMLRIETADAKGGHVRAGLTLCVERLPGTGPSQPPLILASTTSVGTICFILAQARATGIP